MKKQIKKRKQKIVLPISVLSILLLLLAWQVFFIGFLHPFDTFLMVSFVTLPSKCTCMNCLGCSCKPSCLHLQLNLLHFLGFLFSLLVWNGFQQTVVKKMSKSCPDFVKWYYGIWHTTLLNQKYYIMSTEATIPFSCLYGLGYTRQPLVTLGKLTFCL